MLGFGAGLLSQRAGEVAAGKGSGVQARKLRPTSCSGTQCRWRGTCCLGQQAITGLLLVCLLRILSLSFHVSAFYQRLLWWINSLFEAQFSTHLILSAYSTSGLGCIQANAKHVVPALSQVPVSSLSLWKVSTAWAKFTIPLWES